MERDYKDTLNLPRTDFEMKANLSKKEPQMVRFWEEKNVYWGMVNRRKGNAKYVLHDGPPYANGHIHLGTGMNKILKDIVVKCRAMAGFYTPYVPGWDCHGLPIERQVEIELGGNKEKLGAIEFRKKCRAYAEKYISVQREEFKRLLVLGEWENPYLTMNYHYEAKIAREFGKFVRSGNVYLGKKPVYWCATCRTALAEAEVEYKEHSSPSIYVRFRWLKEKGKDSNAKERLLLLEKKAPVYILIWTTTPWTIPANLAIAVHPEFDYVAVLANENIYILAKGLLDYVMEKLKYNYTILDEFKGSELLGLIFKHPIYERDSIVILANYVTLDAGTGCVHTAPGHGREDYESGLEYGIPVYSPVDDDGRFTSDVEYFSGQFVFDANRAVNEKLRELGNLLCEEEIVHQYPHCWRSKDPIIFRSTPQWFISMDKNELRAKALNEIKKVRWDPEWGEERIYGMIETRPDWCISRQRYWGVPIIAFQCSVCGEVLLNADLVDKVADLFEEKGCDVWFEKEVEELLPKEIKCPKCNNRKFEKETDILDVWFDSGVSFAAVIEENPELGFPCDLYLEGSDQHRGWFHSSLLCSVGTRGRAPYRAVLTHGYVVDGEGKKLSKSAGNYIAIDEVVEKYGAEIIRMWVSSENFRNDMRVDMDILDGIVKTYRKVRNTFRYLLGNLYDFDPEKELLKKEEMFQVDRWILHRLELFKRRVLKAYEDFQFHLIYHALNSFCAVDLSAIYIDIVRDRLYCEKAKSRARKSAQTAIYYVIDNLIRLSAPILSYTCEEAYQKLPFSKKEDSVFYLAFPEPDDNLLDENLDAKFEKLFKVRDEVNKIIDQAQKDKKIGHLLEAKILLNVPEDYKELLRSFQNVPEEEEDLAKLFLVSEVVVSDDTLSDAHQSESIPGLNIKLLKAGGEKCPRCWAYSSSPSKEEKFKGLCPRCVKVMREIS